MLRRKAKWTIDNLSDSSMSISIKSKNINTIPKRTWSSNCIRSISSIGDVNATIIESCRKIERRSNRRIPLFIRGGK